MPTDPLNAALDALPPVAEGHVRLYRIQSSVTAPIAAWIQEAQQADGTAQARGRWFTRDPEALRFYLADTRQPELVILDLPVEEAHACALSQLPDSLADGCRPRSFSRDRETEHFVEAARATEGRRWTIADPLPLPQPRPHRHHL